MIMRKEINKGDKVMVSPTLTNVSEWREGTVIDVENNPFLGIVYSVKLPDGSIYSGTKENFEPVIRESCSL